jgi:hypothetical protein
LEPRGLKMFVGQIPRAWGERELLPSGFKIYKCLSS